MQIAEKTKQKKQHVVYSSSSPRANPNACFRKQVFNTSIQYGNPSAYFRDPFSIILRELIICRYIQTHSDIVIYDYGVSLAAPAC